MQTSEPKSTSSFLKTDGGKTKSNAIEVFGFSLPKGGILNHIFKNLNQIIMFTKISTLVFFTFILFNSIFCFSQNTTHKPPIIDVSFSVLKISDFKVVKNEDFWDCSITCSGKLKYIGENSAKNLTIDYSYGFISPNSGLDSKNKSKTISGKIKIAKILPGKSNPFMQIINFKLPVAKNNTSYPDTPIYLCNDNFIAKISRVKGEHTLQNNSKTIKGYPCVN